MATLNPGLPLLQQAEVKDKVVLLRVDHNVIKKGKIKDAFRIDSSLGTIVNILARGGKPVLMTHVGRPYDKKSNTFTFDSNSDVTPLAAYLEQKLCCKVGLIEQPLPSPGQGLTLDKKAADAALDKLKSGRTQLLYLPNTRTLTGEESKGPERQKLAQTLAGLADLYVNDAFGSWQPHASTYDVARYLPSYAGFLLQAELLGLTQALEPERPFLAVVAGSKYDTKIGPVTALYEQADRLALGGVVYNTYLCAKYGVKIEGVEENDIALARQLVEMDRRQGKIVEFSHIVESDSLERKEGGCRVRAVADMKTGESLRLALDVAAQSFSHPEVKKVFREARTIFINAVMGLTPNFPEGSQALYEIAGQNKDARKLYGGGDTLEQIKELNPAQYLRALDDAKSYFFTGGGSVLTALEQRSAYGLEPVKALMGEIKPL
ncbi:MAG: phosphoglycerate kinase [Desulfarculales bacterium]|nr:phosphoglycerate kinase [Desulfarculales bacterium]